MEEIIEKLKEKQNRIGISNYRLAKLSGINPSTMSRVWRGQVHGMTIKTLYDLCEALGMEVVLRDKNN